MRNILLVGLGGMGRVHLANYAYLGDRARVVAVVGRNDQQLVVLQLRQEIA